MTRSAPDCLLATDLLSTRAAGRCTRRAPGRPPRYPAGPSAAGTVPPAAHGPSVPSRSIASISTNEPSWVTVSRWTLTVSRLRARAGALRVVRHRDVGDLHEVDLAPLLDGHQRPERRRRAAPSSQNWTGAIQDHVRALRPVLARAGVEDQVVLDLALPELQAAVRHPKVRVRLIVRAD